MKTWSDNKLNSRRNKRMQQRKAHGRYKTWKTRCKGSKKRMNSLSETGMQQKSGKEMSACNLSESSSDLDKRLKENIKSN